MASSMPHHGRTPPSLVKATRGVDVTVVVTVVQGERMAVNLTTLYLGGHHGAGES